MDCLMIAPESMISAWYFSVVLLSLLLLGAGGLVEEAMVV